MATAIKTDFHITLGRMKTQFSPREQQVIEQLLQGKSNKQIALALGLSVRAVEFHLGNLYAKLGVASRTEAALKLSDLRGSRFAASTTRLKSFQF
jgi:DNA-binding NarL/FixJ family response regulator